ncbi:MAG: hypothetical protein AAF430_22980 [Myxococcota bacterium]
MGRSHPRPSCGSARWALTSAVILALLAPVPAFSQVPAFPGAEGFGATSVGGRGGRVYTVRNLCDYRPFEFDAWQIDPANLPAHCASLDPNARLDESLRYAVEDGAFPGGPETAHARTVVFAVGGTIALQRSLEIELPYLTIAGQTALGEGVTLRNAEGNNSDALRIATHDVIVRHLAIHPGPGCADALEGSGVSINLDPALATGSNSPLFPNCGNGSNLDAISIIDAERVMLDHLSLAWAVDGVIDIFDDPSNATPPRDITFQNSIVAQGLGLSVHLSSGSVVDGQTGLIVPLPHSTGSLLQGGERISLHHNLYYYNLVRNPQINADGPIEFVNNIVYGFDFWGTMVQSQPRSGIPVQPQVDLRGNYYDSGDLCSGLRCGPQPSETGHGSATRFDRARVPTPYVSPHVPIYLRDATEFGTADPLDPDFEIHSAGNTHRNPNGAAGATDMEGFDLDADAPYCADDERNGRSGLERPQSYAAAAPWCPDYSAPWNPATEPQGPTFPYGNVVTAASPIVSGQAHPVTLTTATLHTLLDDVGASRPSRGAPDAAMVASVQAGDRTIRLEPNGAGQFVDRPPRLYAGGTDAWPPPSNAMAPLDADADGMRDSWELAVGLDPTVDDSAGDANSDGFTNLEDYLAVAAPEPSSPMLLLPGALTVAGLARRNARRRRSKSARAAT